MNTPLTDRNTDPSLLILVGLLTKPLHGYAISQDIEATFLVKLSYGTLYGALKRLESDGLVQRITTSNRTKPYKLTAQGRAVTRHEIDKSITFSLEGYRRLDTAVNSTSKHKQNTVILKNREILRSFSNYK